MGASARYLLRVNFIQILILALIGLSIPVTTAHANTNALFRVYLTFEDGPTQTYTPQILDLLAQYGAKATFLIAGYQIRGNETILQREIREGHALVNHLWEEPGVYAGSGDKAVIASYLKTEEAIHTALGAEVGRYEAQPKMFWQPGGAAKPLPNIEGAQVITYNWMVDSGDCGGGMEGLDYFDPIIINNVLNTPKAKNVYWNAYDYGDGVIIAFHDINRVTARVLPTILNELQSAGATFLALPRPWDQVGTLAVRIGVPPAASEGVLGFTMRATTLSLTRMRSTPSLSHNIVSVLPMGASVTAIGRTMRNNSTEWIQVQVDGNVGWVARDLLKLYGPIPSLPLAP